MSNLMETVTRYVDACALRHWRAVFTQEQFQEIMWHCEQKPWEMDLTHRCTIFGVEFTIDDTPRPQMSEAMLASDLTDPAVQAELLYPDVELPSAWGSYRPPGKR